MDIIVFNGQEISLGCFSNLYKKMAYSNNGEFREISTY